MKARKALTIALFCLVALVAVLTVVHLSTRTQVPEGTIAVETADRTVYLDLSGLQTIPVEGTIVNGKGEEKAVSGQGIALLDALAQVGVTAPARVTAIADDEYSAVIEGSELAQEGRVYLLVEDGQGHLVVFGDPNSKRNVSHLTRLVIE